MYKCRERHFNTGACDAKPVDAELVDAAVLEALPRLLPDFDQWVGEIEDRHAAERQRLLDQVERAQEERDRLAGNLAKSRRRYAAVSDEDHDAVLGALRLAEDDLSDAETRLQATEDALASVPEDVGHNRLLDFATSLREAIAGRVEVSGSVEQTNGALVELFASFTICRDLREEIMREEVEAALIPDSLYVFPNLRREAFMRMVAEFDPEADADEPVPPLAWIEALAGGKSANPHE